MPDLPTKTDQVFQTPPNDIDIKELLMALWGGKWLITSVSCFAATISVLYALSLPNIYTASALLAPAESSAGGLSSLTRQYGGLASLAGVSLPGGEGGRAQLGIQLMSSRAFGADFVERRNILPDLMAVDAWDPQSGEIVYDPELYDSNTKIWMREGVPLKSATPSRQAAQKAFTAILVVSQDQLTGYVTVSIEHQSPIIAAQWVEWLVEDVNAAVKARDVAEAKRSIQYLKQQVANTSLADLQEMFFDLIQSQIETVMLAEVRPEYVFKTIDPAVAPEEKSRPSRALICILSTLLGGMLGVFIVLIRHFTQLDNSEDA